MVLLIDEVDRVEVETEALLLEVLDAFQVTIPELGTITATSQPLVVLTSNNTRELSEALKRRCLYLHLDYPIGGTRAADPAVAGRRSARRPWRRRVARGGADDPGCATAQGAVCQRVDRLGEDVAGARSRGR